MDEPNANGELGAVSSPFQPTYYEYDGNDNLTKVTQSDGTVTQERLFKYDGLSRLTHERQVEANATLNDSGVHVGSGTWTGRYKYNTDNLLIEAFDARGVKSAFTYDGLNRVLTATFTGESGYLTPQTIYTYDETETNTYNKGRLTKVRTAENTTFGTPETIQNYRYDKTGKVIKHTQSIGSESYLQEYSYNLAGQVTAQKYPSGRIVETEIDNYGRTAEVSDGQRTYVSGLTFNNQGMLSQMNLGNGTHETYSYNDRFQMTSQSLIKGSDVLQKYDYSYGQTDLATGNIDATKNNGQLGKIESWIGANKQASQRFGYDELSRLSETREYKQGDNNQLTYKQKFDFDRFGNLYRKATSNPTSGQANPIPFTPIENSDINRSKNRFSTDTTYDDAGQVIADDKFRKLGFAYDANGRQVKATKTNQPDAWTVYDALGNRVATKINDVWQLMVYDAFGKLVAEYGMEAETTGGVKYVQQDWQGSIRAVTNSNGFVVARTDHQAFGEDIGIGVGLRSVEQGYSADKATRQGYGLTANDPITGQQDAWFRKLEIQAGRWTRPDPYKGSMSIGDPQSFNRYSYVTNDPINLVDPTGLYEACVHQAMTKFLGNLAKIGSHQAQQIANYAGAAPGGADSDKYKATSIGNQIMRTNLPIHFPSSADIEQGKKDFWGAVRQGERGDWRGYQRAGFILHSIQDGLGAHQGYVATPGHAGDNIAEYFGLGQSPDRVLGDDKFLVAAVETYKLMKNDSTAGLTPDQITDLLNAILNACGDKDLKVVRGIGGGVASGGGGGGGNDRQFDWLYWYYGSNRRPPPRA